MSQIFVLTGMKMSNRSKLSWVLDRGQVINQKENNMESQAEHQGKKIDLQIHHMLRAVMLLSV